MAGGVRLGGGRGGKITNVGRGTRKAPNVPRPGIPIKKGPSSGAPARGTGKAPVGGIPIKATGRGTRKIAPSSKAAVSPVRRSRPRASR